MQAVLTESPLHALLAQRRPLVMGILNVTPDSFSDGGQFFDSAVAIAHARQMAQDGADIIDVGAESTRPYGGMAAVPFEEEMRRLAPVLPAVAFVTCALTSVISSTRWISMAGHFFSSSSVFA